jgi:DNA-binding response OmpR family regulator
LQYPAKKVLVGDSNDIVRTLISHILHQQGFVVDTLSGEDLVAQRLLDSVYDAMILDVDLDGVHALLHSRPEQASRIILTAPRDITANGVHAVLRKPLEFGELVATTFRCANSK